MDQKLPVRIIVTSKFTGTLSYKVVFIYNNVYGDMYVKTYRYIINVPVKYTRFCIL